MGISQHEYNKLIYNLGKNGNKQNQRIEKSEKCRGQSRGGDKVKREIHLILYGFFLEKLKVEYRFHPSRKWRFDFAVPELKLAFEYEGIISDKSRHTGIKGYTEDTNKYNEATLLGWKVYRFTALNYKDIVKYGKKESNRKSDSSS